MTKTPPGRYYLSFAVILAGLALVIRFGVFRSEPTAPVAPVDHDRPTASPVMVRQPVVHEKSAEAPPVSVELAERDPEPLDLPVKKWAPRVKSKGFGSDAKSKIVEEPATNGFTDYELSYISTVVNLPRSLLRRVADSEEYLSRLSRIAAGDLAGLPSGGAGGQPQGIHFSADENSAAGGHAVLTPETGRVYANFTGPVASSHVVVRWEKYTGEVVSFRAYPVNSELETNYVWVENERWDPGYYTVWLLDPLDLSVLARGEYDIW